MERPRGCCREVTLLEAVFGLVGADQRDEEPIDVDALCVEQGLERRQAHTDGTPPGLLS